MGDKKQETYEELLQRLEEYNAAAGQGCRRAELMKAVTKAARRELTPRQLQCLLLFYQAPGASVQGIAKQLGVCPSTVSRHLKKARQRLERSLRYGYFPVWQEEE